MSDKPMNNKSYFDLEMTALFAQGNDTIFYVANPQATILLDGKLVVAPVESYPPDSETRAAIRANVFAEVCVPHHEESAVYGVTFHIFNKPNHQPAIAEALRLKQIAAEVVERYRDRAVKYEQLTLEQTKLEQPTGD